MKITLSPDLERTLLRAIAEGVVSPDVVAQEELSKKAKIIHESICFLLRKRAKPPLKPTSIVLAAHSLFGVEKEDLESYIRSFRDLQAGEEVKAILQSARDKSLLVSVINEAGSQLAKGQLSVSDIGRLLERSKLGASPIKPLASSIKDEFPEPPRGLPLKSLPQICAASRGIIGLWIIGGEPGLGKSTLAFQIALDVASTFPAIYYDCDGSGFEWLLERARVISAGRIKVFRNLTKRFYLRETIATLDEDLSFIRSRYGDAPAVIVIDSLQSLPSSLKFQKESLDGWINRFKDLTKRGFRFVCVSEQNRAHYGEATMSGYKGSGAIEYGGALGMHLLGAEDDDSVVEVHFVKNRHGTRKGHVVDLRRDKKKEFWFNETEVGE